MPDDSRNLQKQDQADTVGKSAKQALERAGGDLDKAAGLLEQSIRADAALCKLLVDPLITLACREAVAKQQREQRAAIWNPPTVERAKITNEARARILGASNLMMFPLPTIGKALGEATRAEIAEAADFYAKQSNDMAHKARWLTLVSQSVPPGKLAKRALSEDRLRELQREAANG
jgi:hypothetical protein